jgi:acyl-coenzyme A synthetase/AMP-(fatty) acid ligase
MSSKLLKAFLLNVNSNAKQFAKRSSLGANYAPLNQLIRGASSSNVGEKPSYASPPPNGLQLIGETINQRLAEMTAQKPTHVAYKFAQIDVELTYAELKQRIDEIAQNLLRIGFERGNTLAIMLPNSPEFVLTVLAAASIGVIAVLMNPTYKEFEIELMLRRNECRAIVMLDHYKTFNHFSIIQSICPELSGCKANEELKSKKLPHLKHVILVDNILLARRDTANIYRGAMGFSQLERFDSVKRELPYVDINDVFALLFTVSFFLYYS